MKCPSRFRPGFTLMELLVVMTIIGILAALVISVAQHAMDQGFRKRAESEIQAFSTALESYKADVGDYPRSRFPGGTEADQIDPSSGTSASISLILYVALSGDTNLNRTVPVGTKPYFTFRPNMLTPKGTNVTTVTALVDPWGVYYGYSTARNANPNGSIGNNPTFDLWSTANSANTSDQKTWIKNW